MSDDHALVIVGGGPAAHAAACGFREAGGQGSIAIVADEGRLPYDRPLLTKELLRGELAESELPLADDTWTVRCGVALVAGRAVVLDPAGRSVTLSGGRELCFGRCLLATGAEPVRLPVPGADDPAVVVLRNLHHFRELIARLDHADHVAVVGSGFIGCEIAASLRRRGHGVTLLSDEAAPNRQRLGDDVAQRIARWLADDGVRLRLGTALDEIERNGATLALHAGGHRSPADLVVMAAGVAARVELARAAGLDERDGAIAVDAAMRTSCDGVLAAGDVASAVNAGAGRPLRVEHWGDALGQGAVAGATAAGAERQWSDVPGFWSTIGEHTLKYVAWGDGFDDVSVDEDGDAFVARYTKDGQLVGVLAHDDDDAYEDGRREIAEAVAAR